MSLCGRLKLRRSPESHMEVNGVLLAVPAAPLVSRTRPLLETRTGER